MATPNELRLLRALLVNADDYEVKTTLVQVLTDFEGSDYEYLEDALIDGFAKEFND